MKEQPEIYCRYTELRQLVSLVEHPQNPNTHPQAQLERLVEVIKGNGWRQPITVSDRSGYIVKGHGRYQAAKLAGFSEVPVEVQHYENEAAELADMLADNRIAELSEIDNAALNEALQALQIEDPEAVSLSGYTDEDWAAIRSELDGMAEDEEEQQEVKDSEVEEAEEVFTQDGDIWVLGKHRMMCGDSTDPGSVALLMQDERADICFTSPPYNMSNGFQTCSKQQRYFNDKVYEEYEDNLKPAEYADFLHSVLTNALSFCDDVMFNIGYCKGALEGTALFLGKAAKTFAGCIIWKKNSAFVPMFDTQHGMLSNLCEPVYVFNSEGKRRLSHPQWPIEKASYNIVETNNASGNEYSKQHKATFPVELPLEVVSRFTEKSCLDLFGGTGTTMIACENLGRKCFSMELSARYCDLAARRFMKTFPEADCYVLRHGKRIDHPFNE